MGKIRVTAGEGRVTPLHSSIASTGNGAQVRLTPGDEIEVDDADFHIQRALRNGDLVRVLVPRELAPGEQLAAAAAPVPHHAEPIAAPSKES